MPIIRQLIAITIAFFGALSAFGFSSSSKQAGLGSDEERFQPSPIVPARPASGSRPAWMSEDGIPVPTAIGGAQVREPQISYRVPQNNDDTVSPLPRQSFRVSQCLEHDHDGVDLAAPRGTPIFAVKEGRVTYAGWIRGYGYTVIIDHGYNTQTLYAHQPPGAIQAAGIRAGVEVTKGQRIGSVGSSGVSTGNHLHFEVRYNRQFLNPTDEIPQIGEASMVHESCQNGHDHNHTPADSPVSSGGRAHSPRRNSGSSGRQVHSPRRIPAPARSGGIR